MAIQILPQATPSMGQQMAEGFSSGINNLAQWKLQEMMRERAQNEMQQGLTPFLGAEKAAQAKYLPPEMLQHGFNISDILKEQARSERSSKTAPLVAEFYRKLYGQQQQPGQQQMTEQQSYEQQEMPQQMMQQEPQMPQAPAYQRPQQQPQLQRPSQIGPSGLPQSTQDIISGGGISPQLQQILSQVEPPKPQMPKRPATPEAAQTPIRPASKREQEMAVAPGISETDMKAVGDLLSQIALEEPETAKELAQAMREQQRIDINNKIEEGRESRFGRKLGYTQIKDADKETQKFYESMADKRADANARTGNIEKQILLNRSGKLDSAGFVKALGMFGLDNVQALLSPESQEFNKIQQTYMSNLKNIYGARPTQWDAKNYLKGIPTLMNSTEGREKVLNDMLILSKLEMDQADRMDQIIEEYNDHIGQPGSSHRPQGLRSILYKEFEPEATALWKKMVYGEQMPMKFGPSQENAPKVGTTYEQLPPPSSVPVGTVLGDGKTKVKSNGYEWTRV